MRQLRAWLFRLSGLFNQHRRDAELSEELESHLQMHIEDNLRLGMSFEQARRDALVKLGGISQVKEKYRERGGMPALEHLFQDVACAARYLRKNLGFTLMAVVTLGLGIGANAAVFSLVNVVLFRPLPIEKPSEVLRIMHGRTRGEIRSWFISFPAYLNYRDHFGNVFTGLAAYVDRFPVNVSAANRSAERVDSGMITGNYFQVLGVSAAVGRSILTEDDRPGADPVIMLSHSFWRRQFAADSKIIGTAVLVDGKPFTIVGVTPANFGGVGFENLPDVWVPMSLAFQIDPLLKSQIPQQRESFSIFGVVGRLKPGVSLQQARERLDSLASVVGAGQLVAAEGRDWRRPWPTIMEATEAARLGRTNFSLLILGIVMLVLLIACSDVAGLMLARSQARQKEIAIRMALGASRWRIVALQLFEGLLVSGCGAILGIAVAYCVTHLFWGAIPPEIPVPVERASSVLDLQVLIFAGLMAVAAGIVSSVAPALRYSRPDLMLTTEGGSRLATVIARKPSIQSSLVVVQVMASVVLLVGAGLFAKTLWRASHVRLGFDPDHAIAGSTDLVRQGYDKTVAAATLGPLLDALRSQPGVASAALGSLPLQPNMSTMVSVEGSEHSSDKEDPVQLVRVSAGYFETLGIPLLAGRDFRAGDNSHAMNVAIINEAMARQYWPNETPIGKHITHVGPSAATFEIIGVAGNVTTQDLRESTGALVYLALDQTYLMFPWQPDATLLARSAGNPHSLESALRAAIDRVNPNLPLFHVRTLHEQAATTVASGRFLARLLLAFSLLATLLAAAGIYGLISYVVASTKREFGIRTALGAAPHKILWLVFRKGLALSLAGVLLGFITALGLTRVVMGLLYGVSPTDPLTFAIVAVLIAVVTLMACYLPARRATRMDPLLVLRYE
jgi:predicted permease